MIVANILIGAFRRAAVRHWDQTSKRILFMTVYSTATIEFAPSKISAVSESMPPRKRNGGKTRSFLSATVKNVFILGIFAVLFGCVPACAEEDGGENTLHVFSWEGVFAPEIIERFEREHDCRVEFDYFDSNDIMYERIREGESGFDVVMATAELAETMDGNGLLLHLDHEKLPNLEYIQSRALRLFPDQERRYSAPYGMAILCVAYNMDLVPEEMRGSWRIFEQSGLRGRTALMTDMRYVMGAALKSLGCSVNSTDPEEIKAAGEVLIRWKENVKYFSIVSARDALVNNELAVIQAFHGAFLNMRKENPRLSFFVPEEGSVVNCNVLVVPVESAKADLAHKFINFVIDPANAVKTMRMSPFYMPIPDARRMFDPDIEKNELFKVSFDALMKCESLRDVGPAIDIYDEKWLEVLLGETE